MYCELYCYAKTQTNYCKSDFCTLSHTEAFKQMLYVKKYGKRARNVLDGQTYGGVLIFETMCVSKQLCLLKRVLF